MGSIKKVGITAQGGSGPVYYPSSTQSDWVVLHENLVNTAETATVLRNPLTYSNSAVYVIRVPPGAVGFKLRARCVITLTAVGTQPLVRIFGMTGAEPTGLGVFANAGTVWSERLDSNGDCDAAGLQISLLPDATTRLQDTIYAYHDTFPTDGRYDARGNKYIMALVERAAGVTGASAVQLMIQFVN